MRDNQIPAFNPAISNTENVQYFHSEKYKLEFKSMGEKNEMPHRVPVWVQTRYVHTVAFWIISSLQWDCSV